MPTLPSLDVNFPNWQPPYATAPTTATFFSVERAFCFLLFLGLQLDPLDHEDPPVYPGLGFGQEDPPELPGLDDPGLDQPPPPIEDPPPPLLPPVRVKEMRQFLSKRK